MTDFFQMGGYAFFVWSSYAIVFIAFTYAFVVPLLAHRKLLRELANTKLSAKRSKVVATLSNADSDSLSKG